MNFVIEKEKSRIYFGLDYFNEDSADIIGQDIYRSNEFLLITLYVPNNKKLDLEKNPEIWTYYKVSVNENQR